MGNSRRASFRLQGWILAARTALFAVALLLLCSSLSVGLFFWAIAIAATTTVVSAKGRQDLLPYCFLAASTMWTGAAVSIALSGGDGIAVLFALCLSAIDSGFFVSSGCKGIRR